MKMQTLLASCVAAAGVLQLAAAAPAAAATTLTADVLRLIEDAVGADTQAAQGDAGGADGDLNWGGQPLGEHGHYRIKFTGTVATYPVDAPMYVTADHGSGHPGDDRDDASSYVYVDVAENKLNDEFLAVYRDGGYMFVHIDAKTGKPRFLGVHDAHSNDAAPDGSLRLIAHDDLEKCALFVLEPFLHDAYIVTLIVNFDRSAAISTGMVLGVPEIYNDRTPTSKYLGVTMRYPEAGVFKFEKLY